MPETATPGAKRRRTMNCTHHWIVGSPQGEFSWGECRNCGRRKRFSNRFDGRDRTNNSDIFVGSPYAWKATRRPLADLNEPDDALELARRAGFVA